MIIKITIYAYIYIYNVFVAIFVLHNHTMFRRAAPPEQSEGSERLGPSTAEVGLYILINNILSSIILN